MKGNVMWLWCLLFLLPVIGSKERACTATGERKITCKFSQNVNSTQKDFGVYFYPDSGGEEPLIDCAWVKEKLHCIKQEGFVVMGSVSDRAELIMPKDFVKQNGSYRCVTGLDDSANVRGDLCRFSEQKVTVATTTKAKNRSIVTVKPDMSKHPKEHSCHTDHSSHQFKAKGCESTQGSPIEVDQPPVLEITLPVVLIFFSVSHGSLCIFLEDKTSFSGSHRNRRQRQLMECQNSFYFVVLLGLLEFLGIGSSNSISCTIADKSQSFVDNRMCTENSYTNFSYQLRTLRIGKNSEDSDFRIEIKLCKAGKLYTLCRCRWIFEDEPSCKSQTDNLVCDADMLEMRLSLLVKRTYSDVTWVYFKQDSSPVVLMHTKLQVTYPPKITGLLVDEQEVNDTLLVDENKEVNISCSVTNGNPPVSVSITDATGHTLSSVDDREGPLVLYLGVLRCHASWPTIRCEAQGSELNRSVSILVRCPPQLYYLATQVLDLKQIFRGLTVGMKAYTRDIRKCLMIQMEPKSSSGEVKCLVTGHAPKFTLTVHVDKEIRIEEGIWMLQVIGELQPSSITFQLINKTGEEHVFVKSFLWFLTLTLTYLSICQSIMYTFYCVCHIG